MSYFFEKALDTELEKAFGHFEGIAQRLSIISASPQLVEGVLADYQGYKLPLIQMGSIRAADHRSLVIEPWDKGALKVIEQALQAANLGLLIKLEERLIRVTIPPTTGEDRERIVKKLKLEKENARIAVRTLRERFAKEIQEKERSGQLTEDERFKAKQQLELMAEAANNRLDDLTDTKISQITKI